MRRIALIALVSILGAMLWASPARALPIESPAPAHRVAWVAEPPAAAPASGDVGGAPQAQVWSWCGVITKEKKLIRMFKKKGGAKIPLYCGGEIYSATPKWGLRHIMWRHQDNWEAKAAITDQNWRELADISIDAVLKDPVIVSKEYDGKRCFSRYVYLWDYQRNRVVDFMTVKVVFRAEGSRKIISAFPSRNNCDL